MRYLDGLDTPPAQPEGLRVADVEGFIAQRALDSQYAAKDLHDLGNHLQLPLVRARKDNRPEVGVDGFQNDLRVAPGVSALGLLTLIAFHCVTLAGLGVGGVAKLDQHGLTLPRAFDRSSEQAV